MQRNSYCMLWRCRGVLYNSRCAIRSAYKALSRHTYYPYSTQATNRLNRHELFFFLIRGGGGGGGVREVSLKKILSS